MEIEETFVLTENDMDRLSVIRCVLERKLTWSDAARQLGVGERQIGNLAAKVRAEGNKGIVHGLRGKPSNHRLKPGLLDDALEIVKDRYPDFGPTFANEKLESLHGVGLSTETLRQGMITRGIWIGRARKPPHRSWRPRRACIGELVQLDASYHDWFEGRGPECALLIYVDDATGEILHGEFVTGEDTLTLMRVTKSYFLRHGRPVSLYVDKHSVSSSGDTILN